jgi:hypothetical protein
MQDGLGIQVKESSKGLKQGTEKIEDGLIAHLGPHTNQLCIWKVKTSSINCCA